MKYAKDAIERQKNNGGKISEEKLQIRGRVNGKKIP